MKLQKHSLFKHGGQHLAFDINMEDDLDEIKTWRQKLHYITNSVTQLIDKNLQVARVTTILTFCTISIVTIRKMKGVRRYTSALDVPQHIYNDVLRVRLIDTSFNVEHRPMFGMFLRNLLLLNNDTRNTSSLIKMRPYGVTTFKSTELNISSQQNYKQHDLNIDTWLTTHLITPKTTLKVIPLHLDDDGTSQIVAHIHGSIYYRGRNDGFLSSYFKTERNISLILIELGLVKTAIEDGKIHDIEFMNVLESAEKVAKQNKIGLWSQTIENNEVGDDVDKEQESDRVPWWKRWFGRRR